MYKIKIEKEITSKLNNNERIEQGNVYKYLSSKSSVLEYCYKNKVDTYYKEDTPNKWQAVKVQQLQEYIYIIYNVISDNNNLIDIIYNNEFYNLEDIANYYGVTSAHLKDYIIETIEDIETKLTNNNLHLLKDKFIIFKELESELI